MTNQLALSIQPLTTSLRMHGRHDPHTSYSLSGTVDVRLADKNRIHSFHTERTSILLTSLIVTFHGQATHTQLSHPPLLNTTKTFNLCSISEELIKQPTVLHFNEIYETSNENHTNSASNVNHYSIIFDLLTIPGWLPATIAAKHLLPHHAAIEHPWNITHAVSSTSYTLTATASYRVLPTASSSLPQICRPRYPSLHSSAQDNDLKNSDDDDNEDDGENDGLACLINTCNPLSTFALTLSSHFGTTDDHSIGYEPITQTEGESSFTEHMDAPTTITSTASPVEILLVRHLVDPMPLNTPPPLNRSPSSPPLFPPTRYTIKPDASSVSPIPSDLISRLQLSVDLPAFVDIREPSIDVSMRMRLLSDEENGNSSSSTNKGTFRATHVEIDVEEHATFRTIRDEGYGSRFGMRFEGQVEAEESQRVVAASTMMDAAGTRTTTAGSTSPLALTSARASRSSWWNTALRSVRGALTSSFSSRLVYATGSDNGNVQTAGFSSSSSPPLSSGSSPNGEGEEEEEKEGKVKERRWRVVKSLLDEHSASSFWLDSESHDDDEEVEEENEKGGYTLDGNWATIRMNATLLNNTTTTESATTSFEYSSEDADADDGDDDETSRRHRRKRIAPTMQTPYLRVGHLIRISAYLSFEDAESGNVVKDMIRFELPLCFVVAPPTTTTTAINTNRSTTAGLQPEEALPTLTASVYREPSTGSSSSVNETTLLSTVDPILPAYSQLFHEDGEARIDTARGVPPVYRPSTPSSSPNQPQQQVLLPEGEVVISKPELVPVGTTVIEWEKIPSLI